MTDNDPKALSEFTVLLVDPDSNMRRIVHGLLRSFGVREVEEAQDARDALTRFRKGAFDLVITEWSLPEISGKKLISAIRHDDSDIRRRAAVMVLSADNLLDNVLAARDTGAHAFLCKPVSAEQVRRHIDGIFSHPRDFIDSPGYVGPDRRFFQDPDYTGSERRTPTDEA